MKDIRIASCSHKKKLYLKKKPKYLIREIYLVSTLFANIVTTYRKQYSKRFKLRFYQIMFTFLRLGADEVQIITE